MFSELVETIGNRLLKLDPETGSKLAEFNGKIIGIHLVESSRPFYLTATDNYISLLEPTGATPDVTLRGSLFAFIRLTIGEDLSVFKDHQIEMEGDAELGQALQKLVRELEIDFEELLSKCIGDVPAHRLGYAVHQFRDWLAATHSNLTLDLAEYLKEESELLVSPIQARHFMDGVDELRADVERLAQRVARLQGKPG